MGYYTDDFFRRLISYFGKRKEGVVNVQFVGGGRGGGSPRGDRAEGVFCKKRDRIFAKEGSLKVY